MVSTLLSILTIELHWLLACQCLRMYGFLNVLLDAYVGLASFILALESLPFGDCRAALFMACSEDSVLLLGFPCECFVLLDFIGLGAQEFWAMGLSCFRLY